MKRLPPTASEVSVSVGEEDSACQPEAIVKPKSVLRSKYRRSAHWHARPSTLEVLDAEIVRSVANPMLARPREVSACQHYRQCAHRAGSGKLCLYSNRPLQNFDCSTRVSKAGHGIDIGRRSLAFPVTPPCIRVRTRRFGRITRQLCSARKEVPSDRNKRRAWREKGLLSG